jgi:choice-of-anchor A domain-containing protein
MSKRFDFESKANERGAMFIVAIVTLTVLLLLGASLIERSQNAVYRSAVQARSVQSFHYAEAGINKAIWALNQPNGWLTYAGEQRTSLEGGFFDVTITPTPSGRGVFTDRVRLLATGYTPGPNGKRRLPKKILAIVHKDPRYFTYAVFGRDKVTIGNGTVTVMSDSYTTDNGQYGGSNVAESGDIGTNSTGANAVEILPQGEVHGSVTVGPTATPQTCVNSRGTITGTVSASEAATILPSITLMPPGMVDLGDVWLEGTQQLTLNEGTYHMSDLDMFGSAQIICNGKVQIYLDQTTDVGNPDVRIGGNGIVNTSMLPSNLVIYCKNDVTSIDISGNAAFYGAIYAPQAAIRLNSGQVYGALVGRTVTMNGATAHVHYDQALRDHSHPRASVRSWQAL